MPPPSLLPTQRPDAGLDDGWVLPGEEVEAPPVVSDEGDGETRPVRWSNAEARPRDPDGDELFVDLESSEPAPGVLLNVVGVRFDDAGPAQPCDAGDHTYRRGEAVVVDSERGPILGRVALPSHRRLCEEPLRRVLRRADAEDEAQRGRSRRRETDAYDLCRERIRALRLPMKLIRAEAPLQGSRLTFYFASEERIDFRDLLRDLTPRLRGRLELRQVGARDQAKLTGGIGDCGRELCCSTFLPAFAPVSIKMAKDQGLVLNPTRITGQCGRLKCCLIYEHPLYLELKKGMPKVGKRVTTPGGEGRVVELDVLRRQLRVVFVEGGSQTFPAEAVAPLFPTGGGPGESEPKDSDGE